MLIPKNASGWFDLLGWVGATAILTAYARISLGAMLQNSMSYHGLNLFGATAVAIVSFRKQVYQPAVINVVWAIIALFALISLLGH